MQGLWFFFCLSYESVGRQTCFNSLRFCISFTGLRSVIVLLFPKLRSEKHTEASHFQVARRAEYPTQSEQKVSKQVINIYERKYVFAYLEAKDG